MKKKGIFLLVFLSFLATNRINAADNSSVYSKNDVGYDRFVDVQGEYRLVIKDNDLYVYDMEGIEKRRITHSAKVNKPEASFSVDRAYILYAESPAENNASGETRYYRVQFNSDDNYRMLISKEEYMALSKRR